MKYDRIAFAAKHRSASYMALENPATKRLVMDPIKEAMIATDDAKREIERLAKLASYWHQMHDDVHELRLQETERLRGHNEALQEREISYRLALAYIAENDDISPRLSSIAREALERP